MVASNPEETNEIPDEEPSGIFADEDVPHFTHELKRMISDPNVLFCNRCGLWSKDLRHSRLHLECALPIKPGNKRSLRLLQHGIKPTKDARMPIELQNLKFRPKGPKPPEV